MKHSYDNRSGSKHRHRRGWERRGRTRWPRGGRAYVKTLFAWRTRKSRIRVTRFVIYCPGRVVGWNLYAYLFVSWRKSNDDVDAVFDYLRLLSERRKRDIRNTRPSSIIPAYRVLDFWLTTRPKKSSLYLFILHVTMSALNIDYRFFFLYTLCQKPTDVHDILVYLMMTHGRRTVVKR